MKGLLASQIKVGQSYVDKRGLIYTVDDLLTENGRRNVKFTRHEPEAAKGTWRLDDFAKMMKAPYTRGDKP